MTSHAQCKHSVSSRSVRTVLFFNLLGNQTCLSAYSEGVAVLLQRCESRVWVADVHCVASALCVSEPQQQRVEAFMKVLYGKKLKVICYSGAVQLKPQLMSFLTF